jgi:O-antigen biosynthesis protein
MERAFSSCPPLGIRAYSDYYDTPEPKVWGDYWFKENLINEFRKAGWPVDNRSPKILLHLFGEPISDLPEDTYNILWIHSHPDRITREILKKYQKVYCISRRFIEKIKKMGFDAEFLMIPTAMIPAFCEKKYDIVFVGNTRQNKPRKIIRDLGSSLYNVKIWGWGWKGLIPDEWFGGEYYDNELLNTLYASSKVVLNDHHDDMRREAFINPRVLDVLASGGFVISDYVPEMNDLLGNSVAVYQSPDELKAMLDLWIGDTAGRDKFSQKGRDIALRHTYEAVCREIMGHIRAISGTLYL